MSDDRHRDLARHERVVVGPVHGVRRAVLVLAHQLAVHEELHGAQHDARRRGHARDDAGGSGEAGAAERRGNPDGEGRILGLRREDVMRKRGAQHRGEDASRPGSKVHGSQGRRTRSGPSDSWISPQGGQALVFVDEVRRARGLQQRDGQMARLVAVLGERQRHVDEVARLAAAQRIFRGSRIPSIT